MGLFDSLLSSLGSQAKNAAAQSVNKAVNQAATNIANGATLANNETKKYTFNSIPASVEELKALPGADLTDPFAVVAFTVLALNAYVANPNAGIEMLNFLKGPQALSPMESNFIKEHAGAEKVRSYFVGATPDNNYAPSMPYTIEVMQLAHSDDQKGEGYKTLFLKSGGADAERQVKLRLKPSTNQWFLWEQMLLSSIREAKSADPWA